jgi:hypothetical protein
MPAINFKQQFTSALSSGEKRQTIRKPRKRQTVPGDTLYLYTGMRTKKVHKLLETVCLAVLPISIWKSSVRLDGVYLKANEIKDLAELDGFATTEAFYEFFRENHGLPFEGEVIKW